MNLEEQLVAWLIAACVLLYTFYIVKRQNNSLPPGPRGLPLVGYIPFMGKHPAQTYCKLGKKFGPIFSVNIGTQTWIVLNDFDSIYEALVKRGDAFSGRPRLHLIHKITDGYGILFKDYDDSFKIQRKFALSTLRGFGVGKRSMEDRITEEIGYLTELIESKNGKSFDCQKVFSTSVSNVICSIMMGSRFSYDDGRFQTLIKLLNKGFADNRDNALTTVIMLFGALRHIPLFSGAYKRLLIDLDCVLGILRDILEEHKKTFDEQNIRDYIDEYLREMSLKKQNNSSFEEIQLLQTMRDFFVAGTETTSSTLRWCILCFGSFSEVQQKVSNEIKEVIGDGIPSMEHKKNMPYTSAFLHEITRHRTLVQLAVPHLTTTDVAIRGFIIPKDTPVLPNLYAANYDPKYFKNPEMFEPERFIDENGQFVSDIHVIPFSVGPRSCLGRQLAEMELFLFLTNIVQRFEIVPDPRKQLPSFFESFSGFAEVAHQFDISFRLRY